MFLFNRIKEKESLKCVSYYSFCNKKSIISCVAGCFYLFVCLFVCLLCAFLCFFAGIFFFFFFFLGVFVGLFAGDESFMLVFFWVDFLNVFVYYL